MRLSLSAFLRRLKNGSLVPYVKDKIFRHLYFNKNYDYKNSVLLAGSARSGTTWVSDIINYNDEYRYMFEPFHSEYVNEYQHFNYRQYLRPNNHKKRFLKPVKYILSGKIQNEWIDKLNRKFLSEKRLIKDVRANLLLKWIKKHFPEIPIIFLIRHPCAVANSRRKKNWETHLDDYLSQENLVDDYLEPFVDIIENTTSTFQKHVLMWCIENYVPLKQFSPGEICVVHYEHICRNPIHEIKRIFSYLDADVDTSVLSKVDVPSPETRGDSAIKTGEDLVNKWKKNVTHQELDNTLANLKHFNLDTQSYDLSKSTTRAIQIEEGCPVACEHPTAPEREIKED